MYALINIFEAFLPQLLAYPNASDPLNGEAAALLLRDPKKYEEKVKGRPSRYEFFNPLTSATEYVQKFASKQAIEEADQATDEDDEMSSVGSYESDDEDGAAGDMEDL